MKSREALLKAALDAVREADDRVHDVLAANYKAGDSISWSINNRLYDGWVIEVLGRDRVRVWNNATGKQRDVHAYDILQAAPAAAL